MRVDQELLDEIGSWPLPYDDAQRSVLFEVVGECAKDPEYSARAMAFFKRETEYWLKRTRQLEKEVRAQRATRMMWRALVYLMLFMALVELWSRY